MTHEATAPHPAPRPIPLTRPWEYELHFPRDPRAPRIARGLLRAVLCAHELGELADRAELLASELATNSVRHTPGPAAMRLRWAHPVLRVSVSDPSPVFPARLAVPCPADREGGRGLELLDLLADTWGGGVREAAAPGRTGKVVWFELRLPATPPTPPALAA
ncbi:ATP-binding protein [Streptomyces sp. C10-9-1]|uniref:ATP-binding protein n=1 Tax=Streptomyces sp. C10-9-1 TaxID=1859285 RepID=UPI002111842A|nr:ATP-binding protein [Streptomyces sp. C10-9-1]MCQ6552679.1 ATP-binding protein [Streptomyces sp. C10-9-1]